MDILFVCMGNICRSPTAEGVFRALAEDEGVEVGVDSAGTGGWHVGAPPDERATAAAAARGIELGGGARQVRVEDFGEFDLLVAMDADNAAGLQRLAPDGEAAEKIRLMREFDPQADGDLDVPDPYYGGPDGFEDVLDMVERSSRGLLEEVRVEALKAASAALGREVASAEPVAGGDLNDAWRLELDDGTPAFAKTGHPGTYEPEAAGLAWLADGGAAVPEVLAASEDVLVLAWVEEASHDPEDLGRMVATMHRAGADEFGVLADGGRAPLRLGPLEIPSDPAPDWATFYARSRVWPLAGRAGLDADGLGVIERLCERMADFAGPAEPPARLHGDLWGGNVMGGPVLIDPAAYGGHREVDLAMLSLFGSPGDRFLAAYQETHPLADGHADRVGLWQLFPLLVHAVLFGGGYGASAVRAARAYVG